MPGIEVEWNECRVSLAVSRDVPGVRKVCIECRESAVLVEVKIRESKGESRRTSVESRILGKQCFYSSVNYYSCTCKVRVQEH